MKKLVLIAIAIGVFAGTSVQAAAGGVWPCLATCFMGDPRIGLYMNDGKPVETLDWVRLWLGIIPTELGPFVSAYDAYAQTSTIKGCCVGFFWGRRAGLEIQNYKLRTKEILLCIPIVNIYPCIALPLEAFGGKTMTQVIEEENLKR
jgi:hypothetical protein